jgi:hypothetical protein
VKAGEKLPPPTKLEIPAPMRKNTVTPTLQVSKFLVSWFATFFERTCPASSMAKPACMKKMRNETISIHV